MKKLITDTFSILFKLTRSGVVSYFAAMIYVTVLNLVILFGMGMLLDDWVSTGIIIRYVVHFPYNVLCVIAMFWVVFRFTPRLQSVMKEAERKTNYSLLIAFTLAAIVLFGYITYCDQIFTM